MLFFTGTQMLRFVPIYGHKGTISAQFHQALVPDSHRKHKQARHQSELHFQVLSDSASL